MTRHRVVFICPHLDQPGKFHDVAHHFMKIAAESLGIELSALDASSVPDLGAAVKERLAAPDAPGGAVLVNSKSLAAGQLQTLDDAGVHFVLAYEGLYQTDRSEVGEPGDPLEHWRSEIIPDDLEVGRLLASTLIEKAVERERLADDGSLRMLTLSGPFTQAATHRLTGFRELVQSHEVEVAYDLHMADWSEDKGYGITRDALASERPHAIWAANDSIARGAARAVSEAGLAPGEDVLIGGVDWVGDSLEQVEQGRWTTTVGGHILDGMWALVMVHDALEGHPPPRERRLTSEMVAATAEDAHRYRRVVDENYLRTIDFRSRFSRSDGRYDFSLDRLLD